MPRKNIKVYEDTFEKLKDKQDRGESMDKVINDLLDENDPVDYAEIEAKVQSAVESVIQQ